MSGLHENKKDVKEKKKKRVEKKDKKEKKMGWKGFHFIHYCGLLDQCRIQRPAGITAGLKIVIIQLLINDFL